MSPKEIAEKYLSDIDEKIIWPWQKHWRNNEGDNYRNRATGIDANMKHHLAVLINNHYESVQTEITKLKEENEKLKKSSEGLRDTLKEISIEQDFFIKNKDYFSEVVRLNLEAREALKADNEIMEGK